MSPLDNIALVREQLQIARNEILEGAKRLPEHPAHDLDGYGDMRRAIIEYLQSDIQLDSEIALLVGVHGGATPVA